MTLFIPSPSISSFQLGPLTLHIYALCLITGIITAWAIGVRRWRARGGTTENFEAVLIWTIPLGIVGARIYHVLTHLGDYFGPGINPWSVFFIWEGGIAIYGAIGAGALAAWLIARREKVAFAAFADALAPGIAIGQASGRFGNWFNQELYGQPTTLPWGLEIDPAHRAPGFEQYATFHPTFLYESLWCLLVAVVLVLVDRRFSLARGQVFALYGILYTLGRGVIEMLRSDQANYVLGLRLNVWTSVTVFAGSVLAFWLLGVRASRESSAEYPPADTSTADEASINESHPSQHPD